MGSKRKSGFHNEAQDARTELQPLALNYAASRSALLFRSFELETTIESCHRQVPIPVLSNSFRSANQSLISEILRRNARNPWLEGVMLSLFHVPNLFVRTVIFLSAGHRRFAISFSAHLGPVL